LCTRHDLQRRPLSHTLDTERESLLLWRADRRGCRTGLWLRLLGPGPTGGVCPYGGIRPAGSGRRESRLPVVRRDARPRWQGRAVRHVCHFRGVDDATCVSRGARVGPQWLATGECLTSRSSRPLARIRSPRLLNVKSDPVSWDTELARMTVT